MQGQLRVRYLLGGAYIILLLGSGVRTKDWHKPYNHGTRTVHHSLSNRGRPVWWCGGCPAELHHYMEIKPTWRAPQTPDISATPTSELGEAKWMGHKCGLEPIGFWMAESWSYTLTVPNVPHTSHPKYSVAIDLYHNNNNNIQCILYATYLSTAILTIFNLYNTSILKYTSNITLSKRSV